MSFDAHKNFSYSTVATAPSPASSGTSLVVQAGDGSLFPAAPFNATVWPSGVQPSSTNGEVVRVTNVATDTFTITRAQESSSARSITVGDQIAATITAKTLTDVEGAALNSGTAFPGSPSDGDWFYRTDRNILYFYNSATTHWLSVDRKYVPVTTTYSNVTGTGGLGRIPVFEDIYIEQWSMRTDVVTTNNGSNFYTLVLQKQDTSGTSTTIATFTTASDSPSTWTSHDVSVAAVHDHATYPVIFVFVSAKTGAPGALSSDAILVVRSVG